MKSLYLFFILLFFQINLFSQTFHSFKISGGQFLLDDKPFQIISGEMHFARIPREYWRDRLHTAKAMGLNTIATYVFWNYHEPEKEQYNFTGNADVAEFVKIAQEEGLWVIIRPSPYACAEWEFGGYPYWLLNEKDMTVRTYNEKFLELSWRYINELAKQLDPLQITCGGPIIMFQVENEYGSYGDDTIYLAVQRDIYRDAGINVELYTCDGPSQMPRGYLPGLLPAVNGLDNVKEVKQLINKYHDGQGPYFIAEWYPGWFDSWGLKHHTVPTKECTGILDTVLMNGLSINFYMEHGGTTFGFMNGANTFEKGAYRPQLTSYDYDAPIDEAGNITPKFIAFREVISKYFPKGATFPPLPEKHKTISLPEIKMKETADLFDNLPVPVENATPLTFENLNQAYGFILYRTSLPGPDHGFLRITKLRDYGIVFVNGQRTGILDRRLWQDSVEIDLKEGENRIEILVENLGRINYGPYLGDNVKGITGKVLFRGKELSEWSHYSLPLSELKHLVFTKVKGTDHPVFKRGVFRIKDPCDTYLDMSQWGKGIAWINGHNLGRYWNVGPQQTLYMPGPWLNKGENEVIVFEEIQPDQEGLISIDTPVLDKLIEPLK